MTIKEDFKRHGGKVEKLGHVGKIRVKCISCGEEFWVPPKIFDRRTRPSCTSCGWPIERLKEGIELQKRVGRKGKESGSVKRAKRKTRR